MNFDKLIARVKAILMTPKTEWPVIAAEPATVADLYKFYIAILAVLPALGALIRTHSLTFALMQYVIALAVTFVVSLIVDALAPTFGGQKNPVQALKLVAYAYTPSFIAGLLLIVPVLGPVLVLVAALYAVYLVFLGLPATMKCPADKAIAYTATIVVVWIVIVLVLASVLGGMFGATAFNVMQR